MNKPHEPLPIYSSSLHSLAGLLFLKARVEGQWTFNSSVPILRAAVAGCGLGFLPEDMVAKELADGSLVRVLEDWCQPFAGYHLYYPNRREHSSAFGVVVDALIYKR